MAFNENALRDNLADLFKGQHSFGGDRRWPNNRDEAGAAWAQCYADFAAGGTSCKLASPTSLTAAQATLATTLAGVFANTNLVATASGIAAALTAFWLTPIVFGVDGVVTAVTGTAALASALQSQWLANIQNGTSADESAAQHAALFHTFSSSVVVTHSALPTCIAPLV